MDYPIELLPCPERKLIEELFRDFYLIRFFEKLEGVDLLNSSDDLNDIYIFGEESTRRIIDLSTVLYGIFKVDHVKLQLTKPIGVDEYGDYCEPDCVVDPPIFEEHFVINQNMLFWTVKVADIASEKIRYHNVHTDETKIAECRVLHTPKKNNFWHFSVDWEVTEGLFRDLKKENRNFEKKAKKFGPAGRAFFKKYASMEVPPNVEIPEKLYLK